MYSSSLPALQVRALPRHAIALALALAFGSPAYAQAPAMTRSTGAAALHDIDVAAGPLADVIGRYAAAAGVVLSFDAGLTQGAQSSGLHGRYTVEQGFSLLLTGTDLQVVEHGPGNYGLRRLPAGVTGSVTTLPTIGVNAAAQREAADGPVSGYRATRTATATWTDTPLRDVPQSIQVVPRTLIQDQQVSSLAEAIDNVSGVSMLSKNGGRAETFVIRGFEVRNYKVDGMTLNQSLISDETNFDSAYVERVEVLKGPASVLYGDSYYGGTVNVVTRRPDVEPGAEASMKVGSYGLKRGEFSITGPINEDRTLAMRLTGAAQEEDSFRDVFGSSKRRFIAPSILWQPSTDTKVWANLSYTEQESPVDAGLVARNGGVLTPYTRYLGEAWNQQNGRKTMFGYGAEHRVNEWLVLRHRGNLNEGYAHRTRAQALGFVATDPTMMRRRSADQYDTSSSQNFIFDGIATFATGPVTHQVVAGVEHQDGDRSVDLYQGTLASISVDNPVYGARRGALSRTSLTKSNVKTDSLFVQDQISLTEQWKLVGGLRYDDTAQTSTTLTASNRYQAHNVTPRAGIVYQPDARLALYGSYSEAFQAVGGVDRLGNTFTPETGTQYEVGAKYELIPDQLSATLSVFQINREGVLTSDPADSNFQLQTGEQRSRGVELDVSGDISSQWRVTAGAAYTEAEITADRDIKPGNRLANSPRWSGSLWSTYRFGESLRGWGVGGGVTAVSARQGDLSNTFTLAGFTRVDAMVFYDINSKLRVALNAKNLFDRNYIRSAQTVTEVYPGDPRTVMLTISGRM